MKTATVRQVRNDFGTVLAWIAEGEEVTVLNRSRPVARLLPPRPQVSTTFKMPDFAARTKALFGERRTHAVEALLKDREESQW
jgi:antitoxin (DNA-binding transcriptional repressor) of toxin-antitoxin stability system